MQILENGCRRTVLDVTTDELSQLTERVTCS